MNPLTKYVQDNLAKGYSREQISQNLSSSGYSQEKISKCFDELNSNNSVQNSTQVRQQLQNYVQNYLSQGYSPEQLYKFLLSQGYKKDDLIYVFKLINTQSYNGNMPLEVIHKHDISSGTIVKIGVALMLMFFIGTGFFFFMQNMNDSNAGKLLDVIVSDTSEKVDVGNNLEFHVLTTNMGKPGKVDVYYNYILRTEYGVLVMKETDTKAFDTTLEFDKNIRIPSDVPSGTYELEVLAVYDSQTAGDKFYFKINNVDIGAITPPTPTNPINTPQTPITPPAQTPTTPVIKPTATNVNVASLSNEKIFNLAIDAKTKEEGIGYCNKITTNNYLHNECLNQLANLYNDEGICLYLAETDRDMCYLGLIVSGRSDLCKNVRDEISINICKQAEYLTDAQNYLATNDSSYGDTNSSDSCNDGDLSGCGLEDIYLGP